MAAWMKRIWGTEPRWGSWMVRAASHGRPCRPTMVWRPKTPLAFNTGKPTVCPPFILPRSQNEAEKVFGRLSNMIESPSSPSESKSQRDFVLQPRVARHGLLWDSPAQSQEPQRGSVLILTAIRRFTYANPRIGVGRGCGPRRVSGVARGGMGVWRRRFAWATGMSLLRWSGDILVADVKPPAKQHFPSLGPVSMGRWAYGGENGNTPSAKVVPRAAGRTPLPVRTKLPPLLCSPKPPNHAFAKSCGPIVAHFL
jgi:hypothetical protein